MKFKNLLFAFLVVFVANITLAQTQPPSADQVLKEAFKEAKAKKKKVFIKFSASWCGWCKKMDASMNDPEIKAYFDESFVIRQFIVMESKGKENLETPGAMELIKKHNSEGFGIPLWFIFDEKGNLMVDSHIRPDGVGLEVKGKNIIGCPAAKEEVESFIKSLKLTTKLNDAALAKIFARFRQNDPTYKAQVVDTPVSRF